MLVGWTGHRPDLFRDPAGARVALDALAEDLKRNHGASTFLTGGQRGVDTWAALAGMRLGVQLQVILPVEVGAFTATDWTPDERALLARILAYASGVRVAGSYTERNRLVATRADVLIAVWTGTPGGGTQETIGFARAAGTPVKHLILEADPAAASARGRGI